MSGKHLFVVLCIIAGGQCIFILDVLKLASFGASSLYHTWSLTETKLAGPGGPKHQFFKQTDDVDFIKRLTTIVEKIDSIERSLFDNKEIYTKLKHLPEIIVADLKIDNYLERIRDMEILYKDFIEKTNGGVNQGNDTYDKATLETMAQHFVSPLDQFPRSFLDSFHYRLVKGHLDSDTLIPKGKGLLDLVAKHAVSLVLAPTNNKEPRAPSSLGVLVID